MQEATRAGVRRSDGVAIVDLPPQIDASAEAALNAAYADAAGGPETRVVLNFSGVDYLSSTGIALVVGILARSRKDGRQVAASGLSDHYREIFEITRLADFMKIYPDERAAIRGI
ncbi:MAG: STAS domain-containing protein [Chloroflexi bacterium]|nr:STAS domain-containing protein [Chloroflexota bacterium]